MPNEVVPIMGQRLIGTKSDGNPILIGVDGNGAIKTAAGDKKANSASIAASVTPSDSTVLEATVGLYVGGFGDVAVTMTGGGDVTFTNLAIGVIHPISVTKVKSTGTTATNIVVVR